nr:hypothetical protein [Pandoravirus aubagnensis]
MSLSLSLSLSLLGPPFPRLFFFPIYDLFQNTQQREKKRRCLFASGASFRFSPPCGPDAERASKRKSKDEKKREGRFLLAPFLPALARKIKSPIAPVLLLVSQSHYHQKRHNQKVVFISLADSRTVKSLPKKSAIQEKMVRAQPILASLCSLFLFMASSNHRTKKMSQKKEREKESPHTKNIVTFFLP